MEFEHDKSWSILKHIIALRLPAKEAWTQFIDAHEKAFGGSFWPDLKQVAIEKEQDDIIQWLQQIVIENPIPENIVAFWIGIVKFFDDQNNAIPTIYIAGAENYELNDLKWTEELSYLPDKRYAQPEALRKMDNLALEDEENYGYLDWILPIAYCAFTFEDIFSRINTQLFLTHQEKLFISTGHDSGDYIDLTPVTGK